ncbi:MAG: NUDIX hydrolase [Solivirus sp.]|uniref:NUDIX hydrolase n=1 Tax=Solivirus sp. TaxID=2487772 RepID=A0A3G5AK33_9VIRU|nr:MAG: NUDIX hydrolase [Solivirus sp.]
MSLIFTVKTDLLLEGYDRFISIYRKITKIPLGGTKAIKQYKDSTIANVLSVDVTDNINRLPQRLTITNFCNSSSITSYGFICRSYSEEDEEYYYLIIKRRESTSYIDLLQGSYRTSQLFLILKDIGEEERNRLCKYSFDALWRDFRFASSETQEEKSVNSRFGNYDHAKERFMQIQPHLISLFNEIDSEDPEGRGMYGFPKGRVDHVEPSSSGTTTATEGETSPSGSPSGAAPATENERESPLDCALREFREETNGVELKDYHILYKDPICEKFVGTNNKNYASYYFLIEVDNQSPIKQFPKEETGIRFATTGEVEHIEWIPYSELSEILKEGRMELCRFANDLEEGIESFNEVWKSPVVETVDDFVEISKDLPKS